jgi:Family of unknown function (DUF5343)
MAVQQSGRAPYASTGSIKTVIEKHRQVGLQNVSLQRLQQIGVTKALSPRTLYALIFLGFYDESGNITPEFDALRKVPEHDFKPRLAALLRKAYVPILENLDPATATQLDVENAFRGFEPTGQLSRMVQLFIGLTVYAGIMPEPKHRAGTGASQPTAKTSRNRPATERGSSGGPGEAGHEHLPERLVPDPPGLLDGRAAERRDISLGGAGSVTVIVNVRWLDLAEDQFTKLRKLIKDIEALGHSGTDSHDRTEVSP